MKTGFPCATRSVELTWLPPGMFRTYSGARLPSLVPTSAVPDGLVGSGTAVAVGGTGV